MNSSTGRAFVTLVLALGRYTSEIVSFYDSELFINQQLSVFYSSQTIHTYQYF